jgi:molybdopterin converting factor small subunit
MKTKFNLQLFANLDEVIAANAQAFEGSDVKTQFSTIASKLSELGYDVLLNNKKQQEFVPIPRLHEAIAQREQFKTQVGEANTQLEAMKKAAGDNQALKDQLQSIMDQNTKLLGDIEQARIDAEIMVAAKDALNPKDVLVFMDKSAIKVSSKGEVIGVEAEIARIKKDKPYLFNAAPTKGSKGGADNGNDKQGSLEGGMNNAIRRAAGRV